MAQSTFSRRARGLFAAALSLSAATARAQETTAPVPNTPGSTCGALVTPPHAAKGEPAVTGSALNRPRWLATRSLRYLTEQAVDVVIADVNPFLQQVRVRSTAEPVVETGLVAFIKIAFGLDLADVATSIPGEQTAPATPTDRRALKFTLPNPCARSRVAIVELGTRHNLDVRLARDLVSGVNATASAVKEFESVLAKEIAVLHSDTAGTKSVARAACSADELLRSQNAAVASAVRPLKARTAALFTEVSRLRDATLKELAANPDCPSLREVVHAVDSLLVAVTTLQSNVALVDERVSEHAALQARIATVRANPDNFFALATVGPFQRSTDATLYLERRPVGSDGAWTELARMRLGFGGGKVFSIGFGVAWSGIVERVYAVRSEYRALSAPGSADSLATVIAVEKDSRGRLTPMVTLDVTPWRTTAPNVHLLGGVTYRVTGSTLALANVQYLPAVGYSLFENKLLLGVGFVAGRQIRLRGGLKLGDPVPASTTSVPTEERTTWVPTGLLVFRFP